MMRKEAREWCQYEDSNYIDHLKDQIRYFNNRLVTRSMEGSAMVSPVSHMIGFLEEELAKRQEEYRREYEDNTLQSSNEGAGEGPTFADGCAEAAVDFLANAKSQDSRFASRKDDSDRSEDIDGQDSVHDADDDRLG